MLSNLEFYRLHQNELVAAYEGQFLLIHDCVIVKSFDELIAAIKFARSHFEPNSYLVVQCTLGDEAYTLHYYNKAVRFVA